MIKNFIINAKQAEVTDKDIRMIFGDVNGDLHSSDEIVITEMKTLEELAVVAAIFPSKTRARKNNFHGPVPHGLSWFGTKKRRFWVWNPIPLAEGEEVVISPNFNHTHKL